MGEDPYLVGMIGSAYVRGLESCGVVATLKHFVGYSASDAARNHAPVSMGPRTLRDVMLVPFEMALREGGARSVMNSYSEIDGLPAAADPALLHRRAARRVGLRGHRGLGLLGDRLPPDHAPRRGRRRRGGRPRPRGGDRRRAAARRAATRSRWPTRCASGRVPESLVDRAARRVLRQKGELGLLDADWSPESPAMAAGELDIDPPEHRAIARELAEASIVLLANDGTLPLGGHRDGSARRAVRGRPARLPRVLLVPQPRRDVGARGHGPRHRGADAARRAACRSCRRAPMRARAGLPGHGARPVGHRRGGRRRPARPTCASRWWATGPASSGAAPRARAATPRTSRCPGSRASWSRRCWRPARPSCSSSSRGDRTRSGPSPADRPPSSRRSSPARRAARRSPACCPGASTPSGRLPVQVPAQHRGAAEHVPASDPRRPQRRGQQPRPDAALPVRSRPLLHLVRVRGLRARRRGDPDGRRGGGVVRRAQRGRPRRHGGRAALHRRPGRAGHPAGDPARGLPPAWRSSPGERRA